MKHTVGIDLGSTTTKAVVLGEDGEILGRGITNSRSNYDVACQVALSEALINARFSLIGGELTRAGLGAQAREQQLAALELTFREQQYRSQLAALDAATRRLAAENQLGGETLQALDALLASMHAEVGALYGAGAERKSDFFRDLAGSRYLSLAEAEVRARTPKRGCGGEGGGAGAPSFDALVGLFDKAILEVENDASAVSSFEDLVLRASHGLAGDAAVLATATSAALAVEFEQVGSVGTGYGRQRLPFPEGSIRSEILCHGLGAHAMFPATRTVLDIGGQDTKAIQVDEQGIVTSFQMNDRCAAGCGRYLGYIADEMNLGLHELGPLAGQSDRPVRINSTCTVFAGAELRERLSLGERREDILAGLHRAIILRAMSLLARSGGVAEQFTFTGGVAKNEAAVSALRGLIADNYGERTMNISPDSIYTGALGAALFALRAAQSREPAQPALTGGLA